MRKVNLTADFGVETLREYARTLRVLQTKHRHNKDEYLCVLTQDLVCEETLPDGEAERLYQLLTVACNSRSSMSLAYVMGDLWPKIRLEEGFSFYQLRATWIEAVIVEVENAIAELESPHA